MLSFCWWAGQGGREGIGNVNGSMFAHSLTVLLFAFADSLNRTNMGYSYGLQSRCPLPRCRSSFIEKQGGSVRWQMIETGLGPW
jgi:hypothetical protein